MSLAAEIRGVTVTCGLGAPFVLEKVPLWAHLLGRGLEELSSGRRTGWGVAFGPLASPTLRAGAPEAPMDAVDWKGGVACICSRPEGATEVVPAPGISYPVTCPSRDSSPILGAPGLGASGSSHPETCCSPSPEPAALPPRHILFAAGPPT